MLKTSCFLLLHLHTQVILLLISIFFMLVFLCWFLLFQVLYHIIVTIFWYGIWSIDQSHLALLRDWIWIVFCALVFGIELIMYALTQMLTQYAVSFEPVLVEYWVLVLVYPFMMRWCAHLDRKAREAVSWVCGNMKKHMSLLFAQLFCVLFLCVLV